MIRHHQLFSQPQVEVWDNLLNIRIPKTPTYPWFYSKIGIWVDLAVDFSPRLISPMSFFFGPFPKLLLRDQEKKMPRFLSALSSRVSSFSDLPDFCFLASCWLKPNKDLTCCTQTKQLFVRGHRTAVCTFLGVESVERSELALCLEGAGLQGIW